METTITNVPTTCGFCGDKISNIKIFYPILEIKYECGHVIWVNLKNNIIEEKEECPAKNT